MAVIYDSFVKALLYWFVTLCLLLSQINLAHANNGESAAGDMKAVALIHWYADNWQGCSGALIAPRVVFTAAHCLSRMPKDGRWKPDSNTELPVSGRLSDSTPMWVVHPGEEVYIDNRSKPNPNRVKVIAQFAPSDYVDSGSLNNDPKLTHGSIHDFGVLILEKPIGSHFFKVADKSIVEFIVSEERSLLAIGYGMSAPNTLPESPNKMSVTAKKNVVIQNQAPCILAPGYCNGSNTIVQAKNKLGQYWGGADSGSPLWYFDGSEWLYIGAMSGPAGCLANHFPNGPSCLDQYWLENGYGEYWTAFTYPEVTLAAMEFLKVQEALEVHQKAEAKAKAEAEAKAKAEAEAKAKAEAEAKASLSKKRTITCVKGKLIKKVAAVNPKCPRGYKKK